MIKKKWIIDTNLREDVVPVIFLAKSLEASLEGLTLVQWRENDPDGSLRRALEKNWPGLAVCPGVERPLLKKTERLGSLRKGFEEQGEGTGAAPPVRHAVDHMIRLLEVGDEPLDILCLGPLTNLALLLRTRPDLKERIGRVVFRGGAVFGGEVTAVAENNVYSDPEAAEIVFRAGLDFSIIPLETAASAVLSDDDTDLLNTSWEEAEKVFARAVQDYPGSFEGVSGTGRILHSLLACLYLDDPDGFQVEQHNVKVDLTGQYTRGSTVIDLLDYTQDPKDCSVVRGLREGTFRNLLTARLHDGNSGPQRRQ